MYCHFFVVGLFDNVCIRFSFCIYLIFCEYVRLCGKASVLLHLHAYEMLTMLLHPGVTCAVRQSAAQF